MYPVKTILMKVTLKQSMHTFHLFLLLLQLRQRFTLLFLNIWSQDR